MQKIMESTEQYTTNKNHNISHKSKPLSVGDVLVEIVTQSLKSSHKWTHALEMHTETVTCGNHKVQINFFFFQKQTQEI